MENNPIHILCTRPVEKTLVEEAVSKGFIVDTIEFIQTIAIKTDALQEQVKALACKPCHVIFTSMNSVDAVTDLLEGSKPSWKIFSMGNTTRQSVIKYFGEEALIATGINSTDLANAIVAYGNRFAPPKTGEINDPENWFVTSRTGIENTNEYIFFCGDQRRDELPGVLKTNNITLTEITIYKTIEFPHVIEINYDAILFFSPSAVHSFFINNKASISTVFYAIGDTTANTIKQYCNNKIAVGDTPAKDELFRYCIQQFESKPGLSTGNR